MIDSFDDLPPYNTIGRTGPSDVETHVLRERLVQAATEVFVELGYAGTDVAEVARHAGADLAEVERLFESKAALLVEAAGRVGQAFFAGVLRRLDEVTPSLVMTALVVELQAGPVTPMHQLWAETLVLSLRDDDIRRHLDPHLRYAQSALEVVVRAAKDDGLIHQSIDTAATAHACITLMFGSCIVNALGLPQPTVQASAGILSKFVDGLGYPTRPELLFDLADLLQPDPVTEAAAEVIEISQASGRRPPRDSTRGAS